MPCLVERFHTVMEKKCEFCASLSSIVYCKSDAAHLCLSCDARVHSANALSHRHPRTLVCQLCGYQPAIVRCFDHEMFMCQICDTSSHHHDVTFQHDKRVIGCYVGCPSAKDLAALWGFELNELENNNNYDCVEFEGGFSSRVTKVVQDDNQQQLILQQILELGRLQLSGGIVDNTRFVPYVKDLFKHDTMPKFHTNSNNQTDHFGLNLDMADPVVDKSDELLSSPFSQLDYFTISGAINPLQGDSFWQYKSPAHNNEIWLQNMQDLGVCDEVRCFDDVDIPDVDLTFRNFEELFGNEHELSIADDDNMECSFVKKLDRGCASTAEDIPGASPVCFNAAEKEIDTSDQIHHLQSNNYRPRAIWPPYSAPSSSFWVSRIIGESSCCSDYKDDGLSPSFSKQIISQVLYDNENTELEAKENVTTRYKEKKGMKCKRSFKPSTRTVARNREKAKLTKAMKTKPKCKCNAKNALMTFS